MENEDNRMKTAVEETKAGASHQPPPQEIILEVFMHCEGCARKVKKSLIGFNGVEDVSTDCKNRRVVVRGDKANPLDVVNRLKKKTHRHVQLLSPVPTSDPNPAPNPDPVQAKNPNSDPNPHPSPSSQELKEKEPVPNKPKPEDKDDQEEKVVVTAVIKIHMHCEACATEIKRRIETMEEVETATPNLEKSEVTVTGTFDPPNLLDYVYKKTGKHGVIFKQEPDEAEEEISKDNEITEEENKEEEEVAEEKKDEENVTQEKKEDAEIVAAVEEPNPEAMAMTMDLRGNWNNGGMYNYYYPPMYKMEMYRGYHAPPPPPPAQMFNDENPNTCSVM